MAQIINTNVASLNAQRNLNKSQSALGTSLQRLSSGLRINSAKDDAAGLAIADRMTTQVRGLTQAMRNANDGISLSQTAEGGLEESSNILQRVRELAIQSANSTNSASDRKALQAETNQLISELSRIANTTTFNGLKVLDGSFTSQSFQVGAEANQTISVSVAGATAEILGTNQISSNNTTATGIATATTAAVDNTAGNNVGSQTLTVVGPSGSDTVSVSANATAKNIATAVNAATGTTGVSATASTTATLGSLSADGTVTFDLYGSNGTAAPISATVTTTDLSSLVDAINAKTGSTGITAAIANSGASVTLTSATGEDIKIGNFEHSAAVTDTGGGGTEVSQTLAVTGGTGSAITLTDGGTTAEAAQTDSTVVGGSLTFSAADGAFTMQSDIAASAGGLFTGAAANSQASSKTSVSQVDISTQSGANSAITVLDGALAKVNSIRADLGAIQNRFESTISNLSTTTENISAARSRIQDADFAAETAQLTRSQILQQAGLAMLAQANSLPQGVLSLLQ